jgi:hypothetical protein
VRGIWKEITVSYAQVTELHKSQNIPDIEKERETMTIFGIEGKVREINRQH